MRRIVLPLLIALSASAASAETFLRFSNSTVPGTTPASESSVWLSAQKLRRDQGGSTTVVRLDRNKLYVINHGAKTYVELALPVNLPASVPEAQRASIEQLGQAMQVTATVTATEERKTLGKDWKTRRYDVALSNKMGLAIDVVIWAGTVPGVDLGQFKILTRNLASLMPGDPKWVEELMKIDGVPVLREVAFRGATTKNREELVAVETKAAPAGTFDVPAEYRKVDFNPMTAMSGF
jgi:hypothetical protein